MTLPDLPVLPPWPDNLWTQAFAFVAIVVVAVFTTALVKRLLHVWGAAEGRAAQTFLELTPLVVGAAGGCVFPAEDFWVGLLIGLAAGLGAEKFYRSILKRFVPRLAQGKEVRA